VYTSDRGEFNGGKANFKKRAAVSPFFAAAAEMGAPLPRETSREVSASGPPLVARKSNFNVNGNRKRNTNHEPRTMSSIQSYEAFFGLNERSAVEETSRFVDEHQGDRTSNVRILEEWNAPFFVAINEVHASDFRSLIFLAAKEVGSRWVCLFARVAQRNVVRRGKRLLPPGKGGGAHQADRGGRVRHEYSSPVPPRAHHQRSEPHLRHLSPATGSPPTSRIGAGTATRYSFSSE